MGAKDILIKPIDAKSANAICKKYHYSGKVVPNSQIHLGVFYHGVCEGVMQLGPSMDKCRMAANLKIGINEFLELNRMAFSDILPKNSESRAISIAIRIIKKKYPFIRVIISFADACQCGDGVIYRAAGFKLHSFKKNTSLLSLSLSATEAVRKYIPSAGGVIARKSLDDHQDSSGRYLSSVARELGSKPLPGFQMKYLYCIDKKLENKYKWIPFSKIPDEVKMYKGIKRIEHESNAAISQMAEGGAIPTDALHNTQYDSPPRCL